MEKKKKIRRAKAEVMQWLRDNNLYDTIARRIPFSMDRFPSDTAQLEDYFYTLFDWRYSPEGYNYWKEINNRYQEWYFNANTK